MADCPGFEATMRATSDRRYQASAPIAAPVTVAFGSRDRILPRRQARYLAELPPGRAVVALPGCGHVPMADDPVAVAALIRSCCADQDEVRCARHGAAGNGSAKYCVSCTTRPSSNSMMLTE